MVIDAVRLPVDVERGAEGGPMFNTAVLITDGGQNSTNQEWSLPLYRGQIGYGIQSKTLFTAVVKFFYARRGRLRGFLFKDWSDYEITAGALGTGDGTTQNFQINKIYTDTILPFTRPITRPIQSSIVVSVNGTPISGSNWSLLTGGIIRFNVAPTLGQVLTVTCEFDIPVRFDTDHLNVRMEIFNAGTIPNLPIVEVRE